MLEDLTLTDLYMHTYREANWGGGRMWHFLGGGIRRVRRKGEILSRQKCAQEAALQFGALGEGIALGGAEEN